MSPSEASDPKISAALLARAQIIAAFAAQDADAVDRLFAPDLLVHAPHNAVIDKAAVMAFFRSGRMAYEGGVTSTIEYAGLREDGVVVMGEEMVKPLETAANAGRTVLRRFTEIWREDHGVWRLSLRQATNVSIA